MISHAAKVWSNPTAPAVVMIGPAKNFRIRPVDSRNPEYATPKVPPEQFAAAELPQPADEEPASADPERHRDEHVARGAGQDPGVDQP
jgi:hypothetical protein